MPRYFIGAVKTLIMNSAVLAITKNGVRIALKLSSTMPDCTAYAPSKLSTGSSEVQWYDESTTAKIKSLFEEYDALVCVFSLGAVIRLISPHLRDKKSDPAVLVIDDKATFVISVLSGHIGGANELTGTVSEILGATPVITTAADVNKTIAVDLIGRNLGWIIEDDINVTRVSAMMVNEDKIGLYQDAGERGWWKGALPDNIVSFNTLDELVESRLGGYLIISDKIIDADIQKNAVLYRPKSLVVGVGLHHGTGAPKIKAGISESLAKFNLSVNSIACIASVKKPADVQGLVEFGNESSIPVRYIEREALAQVQAPNPSDIVDKLEGTPSVSEAAAILESRGTLIVQKQKFPPDLTVAVARMPN